MADDLVYPDNVFELGFATLEFLADAVEVGEEFEVSFLQGLAELLV